MSSLYYALLLATAISSSSAFIFNAFTAFPELKELAKASTDTSLNIRLDIGGPNENHLILDGLELECLQSASKKSSVSMPGADGPHKQTSSGKKDVHVTQAPFYVGMFGKERVKLLNGAWEMVWRVDAPSGSLICGFDVADKVRMIFGGVVRFPDNDDTDH
jgi:hypothetical protein